MYEPTRWWRVMRDGKLWCQTSSEHEARSYMEPGDVLERLYQETREEWITCAEEPYCFMHSPDDGYVEEYN